MILPLTTAVWFALGVAVLSRRDVTRLPEVLILGFYFLSALAKNTCTNVGNFLQVRNFNMPILDFRLSCEVAVIWACIVTLCSGFDKP